MKIFFHNRFSLKIFLEHEKNRNSLKKTIVKVVRRYYNIIDERGKTMPEITRFYGIIQISNLEMIEGDLPQKAQNLVKEWAAMYQKDLMTMWNKKELKKLPPLE